MWEDTHYIDKIVKENGWQRGKVPKEYDFTIITIVKNLDSYKEFCECLKKQVGTNAVEIIAIPNFYNTFTSAYKALNIASDIAFGKNLILCHDDILVPNNWLNTIKKNINELDSNQIQWGVLGPAGVNIDDDKGIYFLLDNNMNIINSSIKNRQEVFSLDELCLITKKSNGLRFSDKQLTGFHFYGGNICIESKLKNLKNFSIPCYCFHKSDGTKNISTQEKWNLYEESLKSFHLWVKSKGIKQWRTTTAKGINDEITIFTKKPNS
jgi:hypothetical protein